MTQFHFRSDSKAGHFEPAEFGDRYEVEMVEVLKKKQAGMPVKKGKLPPKAALSNEGRC